LGEELRQEATGDLAMVLRTYCPDTARTEPERAIRVVRQEEPLEHRVEWLNLDVCTDDRAGGVCCVRALLSNLPAPQHSLSRSGAPKLASYKSDFRLNKPSNRRLSNRCSIH
jgi:hypothetical protein